VQSASDTLIGLGAVFTLLFITLGPLKILGPFAHVAHDVGPVTERRIAVWAFGIALVAAVAGGFLGKALLHNWQVSPEAMLLAGGVVFFLVGLNLVLEQYEPAHPPPPPSPSPSPLAAAMRIAFPTILTPYGIAALIVLLANSPDGARTAGVVAILSGVMVLNLLAMLYARRIMGGVTAMVFRIFGAVLGVLQLALAVEMILRALHGIGVLQG
jgi:multiple antibiotic resistance protein